MIGFLYNLGVKDLEKFIHTILLTLFKYAKGSEALLSDKVKFILKDNALSELPVTAICDINIISSEKPKKTDSGVTNKKIPKKGPANQKIIHEYDYYDKSPFLPYLSDNNCKIICYSHNFEKIIRYNILDCINKLYKIDDLDKEAFLSNMELNYKENFITPFVSDLANKYKKEIITFDYDLTQQ